MSEPDFSLADYEDYDNAASEQVMLKLNDVIFRCECGCNVFTKEERTGIDYICNSCERLYR